MAHLRRARPSPLPLPLRHERRQPLRPHRYSVLTAYLGLMKPRIIVLLLITAVGAMFLAADGFPPISALIATLIGGTLGAGGASAINNYFDRDIDRLMPRTATRPLPAGTVRPAAALAFGISLVALSFLVLSWNANVLAASLMLAGGLFYIFVYTGWLKRSSIHNIVIGGAAGAVSPLVGWAAVTGGLDLLPILLFLIIFFWTPPHFWALSLVLKEEYEHAQVPMLPVIRGERETRYQILLYSVVLTGLSLAPPLFGLLGPRYLAMAAALSGALLLLAGRLAVTGKRQHASVLFRYSLAYLALLFTAMVIDRILLH